MRHVTIKVSTGLILFLFLSYSSCEKAEEKPMVDTSFLIHKWKVLSMATQATLEAATGNYYLQFYPEGQSGLQLDMTVDRNACTGHYSVPEENKIVFSTYWCTKACCDSDYAIRLLSVLQSMDKNTAYEIRGDSLILLRTGSGKLILQRIN
jgi:hypothetical protein